MKYDIFISYKRRGTSSATAAYLYELLLQKGYNVFFDRKEMRSGRFNEQLLEHIGNATDILILLEDGSLGSWFDHRPVKSPGNADSLEDGFEGDSDPQEEPYKTDWFCKEVMYALSLKGKNIVPILLNGYKMPEEKDLPPEMKDLSVHNALSLEISEVPEFCDKYFVEQGYLKSRPTNLSMSRRFQSKGGVVGCFLFYTEAANCDIYECGEMVTTLTDDCDEWHPFRYPVSFAGEHRFKAINNDSCEVAAIRCSVDTNCQQYVHVEFSETRNLWALTKDAIKSQTDPAVLCRWGQGLFEGTSKHEPDVSLSFECLSRAVLLGSQEALAFICRNSSGLITYKHVSAELAIQWYQVAAEQGSRDAQLNLGRIYYKGKYAKQDYKMAAEWFLKAAEQGEPVSQRLLGNIYRKGLGVKENDDEALKWYKKSADQGHAPAFNSLAWTYHLKGDYNSALPWAEKAAAALPDKPYVIDTLATVYEGLDRYEEALKQFEKCLRMYEEAGNEDKRQRTAQKIAALKDKMK